MREGSPAVCHAGGTPTRLRRSAGPEAEAGAAGAGEAGASLILIEEVLTGPSWGGTAIAPAGRAPAGRSRQARSLQGGWEKVDVVGDQGYRRRGDYEQEGRSSAVIPAWRRFRRTLADLAAIAVKEALRAQSARRWRSASGSVLSGSTWRADRFSKAARALAVISRLSYRLCSR